MEPQPQPQPPQRRRDDDIDDGELSEGARGAGTPEPKVVLARSNGHQLLLLEGDGVVVRSRSSLGIKGTPPTTTSPATTVQKGMRKNSERTKPATVAMAIVGILSKVPPLAKKCGDNHPSIMRMMMMMMIPPPRRRTRMIGRTGVRATRCRVPDRVPRARRGA